MAKKSNNDQKKTGRPQKEIDKKLFESLCSIFCTKDEIAEVMECSDDTISRWCQREYGCSFAEVYKKKSSRGKASLRRMQFKSAESGNVTMQIFLGKNYLGQSDRAEIEAPDTQINITVAAATEEDIESDD